MINTSNLLIWSAMLPKVIKEELLPKSIDETAAFELARFC